MVQHGQRHVTVLPSHESHDHAACHMPHAACQAWFKKTENMAAEAAGLLEPWKRALFQETFGDSLTAARKVLTVYYLNLCTVGVVGAGKLSWFTEFISSKLHEAPESSIAIIIQTNRAGDDCAVKREDGDSEEEDGESGSKAAKAYCYGGGSRTGSTNAVRLSKQRIVDTFLADSKKLHVMDMTLTFESSSVYGARAETHEALLMTASVEGQRQNLFHKSRLWRRRLVRDIPMLPAKQFVRPYLVRDNLLPPQGPLTIVQQYKQAT
jgi:hypothetical protein